MKFIDKVKSSKAFKKTVAVIASASLAISAMAVNVFAAEGGSGGAVSVDYGAMVTTITSSISEIINQCVSLATAVLPLGLGILGLLKLLDLGKKFFVKSTS